MKKDNLLDRLNQIVETIQSGLTGNAEVLLLQLINQIQSEPLKKLDGFKIARKNGEIPLVSYNKNYLGMLFDGNPQVSHFIHNIFNNGDIRGIEAYIELTENILISVEEVLMEATYSYLNETYPDWDLED